jgi:hypothetical protein
MNSVVTLVKKNCCLLKGVDTYYQTNTFCSYFFRQTQIQDQPIKPNDFNKRALSIYYYNLLYHCKVTFVNNEKLDILSFSSKLKG